jgi:hypothetical protein
MARLPEPMENAASRSSRRVVTRSGEFISILVQYLGNKAVLFWKKRTKKLFVILGQGRFTSTVQIIKSFCALFSKSAT